ncbi:TIGR04083 family peptide-modifying radical SAM enzyme [Methanorbis rubei]|uniref:Anaerobic sulfatase-maturating enzyme n=1 Tax=Methanorbis rubei TaxID=3028300 RepID=A0AAE4MGV6_9EURY|nr:Anaerobic sulfatase-maturating enzyme [Methanocorpusculaceae archaeon Cs1]
MKNPFHVMIIPTLGCPGRCKYCWSSDVNSPKMTLATAEAIVRWLEPLQDQRVTFTFHGGEPLLAGPEFYREVLPMIEKRLPHLSPEFAMQTNLWLMTDELAEILSSHHVPLGSSIDGPKDLTDYQRGDDYFERTLAGYRTATAHGLLVRFICTFTNSSVERKEEIVEFFRSQGWGMKLHPALPSLKGDNPNEWTLSPTEYGELLVYLLDAALANPDDLEIMNINDLCRCVFTRSGCVCTYADCMGTTFAIGPNGDIYPCYRFVGMPEWVMGNVHDAPTVEMLMQTQAGVRMLAFKDHVDSACKDCAHINYCRGGCPYNALAGDADASGVDPHCVAYKRIFDEITARMEAEMQAAPAVPAGARVSRVRRKEKPGVMMLMRKIVEK